jgi:hypothetical protein
MRELRDTSRSRRGRDSCSGRFVLDKLTSDDFSELRSGFRIHSGSVSLDADLIDRREWVPSPEDTGRRRPFSIVFRTAMEPILEQRTYEVEHQDLGLFALFLVPIGPDDEGMRYEAVFN